MFKGNTVGEKEYSLEKRTREGKYLEISVLKEIKASILIEEVVTQVHVTHIGPKGMLKFEFDGMSWICDAPAIQRYDSVAINETRTRAIYCKDLTYDRSDINSLQDYYAISDHAEDVWVEVPEQVYGNNPS